MARHDSALGWLRAHDRARWVAELRETIARHDGSFTLMAHELGVTERHVARWVREAGLRGDAERARAELAKREEQARRMLDLT